MLACTYVHGLASLADKQTREVTTTSITTMKCIASCCEQLHEGIQICIMMVRHPHLTVGQAQDR